jgi:hypothetical protein
VRISVIELLVNNAESFWNAAQTSAKLVNVSLLEEKYSPAILSNLTVAATNLSFAIELYFKAISMVVSEESLFGHDLFTLYKRLPKQTQHDVLDTYIQVLKEYESDFRSFRIAIQKEESKVDPMNNISINHGDLVLLLKRHNQTFTRWRYMHEVKTDPLLHLDFPRLECLFMAVRNTFFNESVKQGFKFTAQHN